MLWNLAAVALLLAALAAVACYAAPETKKARPCCSDKGHNHPEWSEILYCPNRGR